MSGTAPFWGGGVHAEPIWHLSPSDPHSLALRHHWSRALAYAYLQGFDDSDSDRSIGGIFVFDGACFTLIKIATSPAWSGPTIFYLTDLFQDDDALNVQGWEMSATCDGIIKLTDIFYEGG